MKKEVCTISKYDDIFECMKYFKDSRYTLYIYEDDKPYYDWKVNIVNITSTKYDENTLRQKKI